MIFKCGFLYGYTVIFSFVFPLNVLCLREVFEVSLHFVVMT